MSLSLARSGEGVAILATEIERKFLLANDDWRPAVTEVRNYRQGYIANTALSSIRIRLSDTAAYINIKGATLTIARDEFDYQIPYPDGLELIDKYCLEAVVEKRRHIVPYQGHYWEIDVFSGDNAGLVVAEIELVAVDEVFARPPWLGLEVSDDRRYYNVCLARHPYKDW